MTQVWLFWTAINLVLAIVLHNWGNFAVAWVFLVMAAVSYWKERKNSARAP